MDEITLRPIAYIRTDFPEKFGVPRQSGILPGLRGEIVFLPEFSDRNALRGIEGYSHLWILWGFSENERKNGKWSPTVRPPRLGGNTRMGVFASRSPFRPNPVGLSVVKLEKVESSTADGLILSVSGIDMADGTPVYDIKPYLRYVDSIPDASDGFALASRENVLKVEISEDLESELLKFLKEEKYEALKGVLGQDPRPQYADDPDRVYRMSFAGLTVSFSVSGEALKVINAERIVKI